MDINSEIDEEILVSPYNYCDYWCERCIEEVKEKCLVYNKELEAAEEGKSTLEMMSEGLEQAFNMIHQFMQENDIDISKIMEEADEDDPFLKIHQEVKAKPLVKLCRDYLDKTETFLRDYREHYLTPPVLTDAFTNMGWYRTILPVKMERTLHSLYEFVAMADEYALQDAYFTSMVVYKSLNRSLKAVTVLKENLVDYQDILTEVEDILLNIKNELKHEFPFDLLVRILARHIAGNKKKRAAKIVKRKT